MEKQRVIIDFGGKKVTFLSNGKKRSKIGDGLVAVNMDMIFADNSYFDAIGVFDESSSGELCGAFIFTESGLVQQAEFVKATGKTKTEVYPYRYKYRKQLHCEDIHVNSSGWNR